MNVPTPPYRILHHVHTLATQESISCYDLTAEINRWLAEVQWQEGQVLVCSRHTTTSLILNEFEPRLLDDIRAYLEKLAPRGDRYLHNDLHLRPNIPENEPENAHSHLMAITLSPSLVLPVMAGQLALGTYQSVILVELDGPRDRTVYWQASGV
jgi:secondary thiamine-phosphate synthase enzyme